MKIARLLGLLSAASLFQVASVHAVPIVEAIALSGDPVPGAPVGTIFPPGVGTPSLNNSGDTIITLSNSGLFKKPLDGPLREVVLQGGFFPGIQPAPGTGGTAEFSTVVFQEILDESGGVTFAGTLSGPTITTANDNGLWRERDGVVELLMRQGDSAPGTPPGVKFGTSTGPGLLNLHAASESGNLVFTSQIHGPGIAGNNDLSIWKIDAGQPALIAQEGQAAPGTGGLFSSFSTSNTIFDRPSVINDAGDVAFRADLSPGIDVSALNNRGIWLHDDGDLSLVVREGTFNAASGQTFDFVSDPMITDSAEVVFFGEDPLQALWRSDATTVVEIVRQGETAPGLAPGTEFANISPQFTVNGAGEVAFEALLEGPGVTGSNRTSIWRTQEGSISLFIRTGDQAPGTDTDVTFSEFQRFVLNDAGQALVIAELSGPGVDDSNNRGIWIENPDTGLLELFLRGQMDLEVRPGDIRTVADIGIIDNGAFAFAFDRGRSGFNDLGQLAFFAKFTDQTTGAFFSAGIGGNETLVSEPRIFDLLLICLFALLYFLKKRVQIA